MDINRLKRLEAYLDAKAQESHRRRFKVLQARLNGDEDPAKRRNRWDAIRGSMHSFPYMLWTVRRQIWHEKAFQTEVVCLVLGTVLGLLRGFTGTHWAILGVVGVAALLAEANNTASELTLRQFQQEEYGGILLNIHLGDLFEFAALPVAMCVWPWGLIWVYFMVFPR